MSSTGHSDLQYQTGRLTPLIDRDYGLCFTEVPGQRYVQPGGPCSVGSIH